MSARHFAGLQAVKTRRSDAKAQMAAPRDRICHELAVHFSMHESDTLLDSWPSHHNPLPTEHTVVLQLFTYMRYSKRRFPGPMKQLLKINVTD